MAGILNAKKSGYFLGMAFWGTVISFGIRAGILSGITRFMGIAFRGAGAKGSKRMKVEAQRWAGSPSAGATY